MLSLSRGREDGVAARRWWREETRRAGARPREDRPPWTPRGAVCDPRWSRCSSTDSEAGLRIGVTQRFRDVDTGKARVHPGQDPGRDRTPAARPLAGCARDGTRSPARRQPRPRPGRLADRRLPGPAAGAAMVMTPAVRAGAGPGNLRNAGLPRAKPRSDRKKGGVRAEGAETRRTRTRSGRPAGALSCSWERSESGKCFPVRCVVEVGCSGVACILC